MRYIFNKKQLFVIWFVGVVVCFFILQSSVIFGNQALQIYNYGIAQWKIYSYNPPCIINWFRLSLIPFIIGVLLVITFSKR